jgi:EF hand domain-containing protein
MSKRLTAAILLGAFTASSAALAQGMSFQAVDSNQDGFVSFEEITAAVPTMSEDLFQAADVNQDNLLDPEEFATVQP